MTARNDSESFEAILEHVRQTRGFDFTAYKRASLMRRVVKRMHAVGVPSFDAYLDCLQVHPEELETLFDSILINVTSFFRDADVWDYVDTEILPAIMADHPSPAPIRIWSAGCASGQEAYSVAMLLAERLGIDGLRERVKIYATDVDNEALMHARQASYPVRQITEVPPLFLDRYFVSSGGHFTLNREVRRAVIFGNLDLIQDSPISRVDLLMCRNTLMYFSAEAQSRILNRFTFSLNPNGFLVLGRAEMPCSQSALVGAVDLKRRVFRVVARGHHRERLDPLNHAARTAMVQTVPKDLRLRQATFAAQPVARHALDTAHEELQSTSEELETTHEELETTYEELQATNEELATMNEQLQSTNEELQMINDEMRSRSSDLNALNGFFEAILSSLRSAVVVLDREYRIQVWNDGARELWGLRREEAVGAHFSGLDIGLPVAQLTPPLRDVLSGAQTQAQVSLTATSRRGKSLECSVTITPLRQPDTPDIAGAILVMAEQIGAPDD